MLSILEIDRENDLAYILLRPELKGRRGAVARSVRAADDVVFDLDAAGQIIGIELLHASSLLSLDKLSEGSSNLIVGVKEAAQMLGIEKSNFVRDHANRSDFPAPLAELASGRLWLRSAILQYLESRTKGRQSHSRPRKQTGKSNRSSQQKTPRLPRSR